MRIMLRELCLAGLVYLSFRSVLALETKVICRDEEGQDVDWFYLYKLPKHYNNAHKSESNGLQYLYITSRQHDQWSLSRKLINASDSIPARTLEPLFDDPAVLLIGYNDEFPNGTFFLTDGHTKGVVATDGSTALWLIHSVPKFPTIPGYQYPASGTRYGQSFLCLTLTADELHKVGEQMVFNEPNTYYSRFPKNLKGRYPQLAAAVERRWHKMAPYNNELDIQTLGGKQFRTFAKSSKYGRDLYSDWLATALDVNLLVESWRNGGGNLGSNCSRDDKVYNIASLRQRELQLSFKTTTDHSKWAVSQATGFKLWRWRIGGEDWICVGDLNRQSHQLERGGGTVCQKNSKVTELYRDLISNYDPCN